MGEPTNLHPRVFIADQRSVSALPSCARDAIGELRGDRSEHMWTADGLEWCVAAIGPSSWPLFVVTAFARDGSSSPPRSITSSPFPMWVFDRATFRFVSLNEPAALLFGRSMVDLIGERVVDFQAWSEAFELVRWVAELTPERVMQKQLQIRRRDGSTARVDAQLIATDHDGRPACVVLTGRERR